MIEAQRSLRPFLPLDAPTPFLFFTGKGGVGKTSLACATAIGLADRGRRVLLVSTDPASNLDEMLGIALDDTPEPVPGVPGLFAMNIDPEAAAEEYRARVLEQLDPSMPDEERATVREQLSGACTTEIAAFDEFVGLLAGDVSGLITSSSIRPRRDTPSGCSACPRHGPGSWRATTAARRALARIPA